jgi:hypothetical protein
MKVRYFDTRGSFSDSTLEEYIKAIYIAVCTKINKCTLVKLFSYIYRVYTKELCSFKNS